jgi:hypothetical protein
VVLVIVVSSNRRGLVTAAVSFYAQRRRIAKVRMPQGFL